MGPKSVHFGLSMDGFHPYNSDSTVYSCWPIFMMSYNLSPSEGRVYIPCSCDSGSEGTDEANEYIFAFVDGRVERIVARGRCI
jgi:hypothetical protein